MFGIGNKFGARTKPKPEMIQSDCAATITDAHALLIHANQAHDAKTAELNEARSKLAELDAIVGEKLADDLDASAEVLARQSAQGRVTQLELACGILRQRQQDAATALKAVEQAAAEDAKAADRARGLALAPKGEALLVAIEEFVEEVYLVTENARVSGGLDFYTVGKIRAQLNFWLGVAKRPPGTKGADSGAFREFKSWSECLEKLCGSPP